MSWYGLRVELTTRCNANCSYCPRFVIPSNRSLGDIEPRMMDIVLDRIEELNEKLPAPREGHPIPVQLGISGFGEPLLFPKLFKFIHEVKARCQKIHLALNTNGILLKGKLARKLIDRVDVLQVSLGLPTPELYAKHKKSNTFWQVRNNLLDFYKMKGTRKPVTDIRLLHFGDTAPHLKYIWKVFKRVLPKGDAIRVARLENWMGLIDAAKFGMEYIEPPATASKGILLATSSQGKRIAMCADLTGNYLAIQKGGFAFACCLAMALPHNHPTCLGNVEDHSIKELLASPKRIQLYEAQKKGELQYECQTCSKPKYTLSENLAEFVKDPSWLDETAFLRISRSETDVVR